MSEIYCHNNYRDYLRRYYENRKSENAKFSYRMFSRMIGFSSPNFLKLIILGQRNLSKKGIQKITNGLKFDNNESQFFENLVQYNQSQDNSDKKKFYEKLQFFKAYADVKLIDKKYQNFLSNWYYPAIREMTLLSSFREDPDWIVRNLSDQITLEDAKQAIQHMVDLGLLKKNKQNKLKPANQKISTDPEVADLDVKNIHRQFIDKAKASLDDTPSEFREISTLTVAVNQKTFEKSKKLIQKFRRELNVILSQSNDVDTVYQLNFQFFNLAKLPWKTKDETKA